MRSPCCYKNTSISSKARTWNLDPALLQLALTASQKCFWETEPRYPSAGTHASSFLLKLCRFLSVSYSPLHKAHRLVHVAFNSIDHSTLTAGVASGESNAKIYEGMHRNREREADSPAMWSAWLLKGSMMCGHIKWLKSDKTVFFFF